MFSPYTHLNFDSPLLEFFCFVLFLIFAPLWLQLLVVFNPTTLKHYFLLFVFPFLEPHLLASIQIKLQYALITCLQCLPIGAVVFVRPVQHWPQAVCFGSTSRILPDSLLQELRPHLFPLQYILLCLLQCKPLSEVIYIYIQKKKTLIKSLLNTVLFSFPCSALFSSGYGCGSVSAEKISKKLHHRAVRLVPYKPRYRLCK